MRLAETIVAADPGLVRLRTGVRATLASLVAGALMPALATALGQPALLVVLIGIFTAMLAATFAEDAPRAEQRWVAWWLVVPALAATVLAAVVAPSPWLSGGTFLLVVFVSIYARRFGNRGFALGSMFFLMYFLVLYFRMPLASLPAAAAAIVVSAVLADGVRFVLVPDRPKQLLAASLRSFHAQIGLLLDDLAAVVRDGRLSRRRQRRLSAALARLNEAALLVEDQLLAGAKPRGVAATEAVTLQLFEAELSMESLVGAVRQAADSGALARVTAEARGALREALAEARREVQGAKRRAEDVAAGERPTRALAEAIARCQEMLGRGGGAAVGGGAAAAAAPGRAAGGGAEEGRGSAAEGRAEPRTELAGGAGAKTEVAGGMGAEPPQGGSASSAVARLDSSLRQALQATIACALAMVVGGWVSKERWLWAVLTAFVVFTGAATRSETLVRAWHRTFGTLVGVAAGLAVARLTAGHHDLQLALSFASIFGAFYALRSSYAVAVFFFTAQLALVYGVLGLFTPELLYLRIEETLVGVAVGTLVVAFVLPAHGRDKVRRTAVAALQCMHDLLADPGPSCRGALATSQLRRLRDLDRQVRNVRVQARPLVEGPWSRLTPDLVVATHALFALAFYVRRIARQTESRNDVDTSHLVRRLAGLTRGRQTLGVKPSRPDRPRPAAWLPPDQDDPRRSAGRMEQLLDDLERSL